MFFHNKSATDVVEHVLCILDRQMCVSMPDSRNHYFLLARPSQALPASYLRQIGTSHPANNCLALSSEGRIFKEVKQAFCPNKPERWFLAIIQGAGSGDLSRLSRCWPGQGTILSHYPYHPSLHKAWLHSATPQDTMPQYKSSPCN